MDLHAKSQVSCPHGTDSAPTPPAGHVMRPIPSAADNRLMRGVPLPECDRPGRHGEPAPLLAPTGRAPRLPAGSHRVPRRHSELQGIVLRATRAAGCAGRFAVPELRGEVECGTGPGLCPRMDPCLRAARRLGSGTGALVRSTRGSLGANRRRFVPGRGAGFAPPEDRVQARRRGRPYVRHDGGIVSKTGTFDRTAGLKDVEMQNGPVRYDRPRPDTGASVPVAHQTLTGEQRESRP
jgi:hypothetical protein